MFTPGLRACAYKTASGRGKWPNHDPIGERGGLNLYGFVANNPISRIDPLGLSLYSFPQRAFFNVDIETHHYYSDVIISYSTGWASQGCPNCKSIKLAQIVKVIYEDALQHIVHGENWKLDTDSSSSPWYPYQTQQFGSASMTDAPGARWYFPLDQIYGATQMFETCAVCLDKPGQPSILGCASWGQSIGGIRSSSSWGGGKGINPVSPSADFTRLFSSH